MILLGCIRFRMRRFLGACIFYVFLAIFLAGCASVPTLKTADTDLEAKWLSFVKDNISTKQDILLKLGLPSAQFENEKILIYRLMLDEKDGLVPVDRSFAPQDPRISQWYQGQFNLVLVFDERNVLVRHSFLKVR